MIRAVERSRIIPLDYLQLGHDLLLRKHQTGGQLLAEYATHRTEVARFLAFDDRNQFGLRGFQSAANQVNRRGRKIASDIARTCAIEASASSEFFTRNSASTQRDAVTGGITWLIGP